MKPRIWPAPVTLTGTAVQLVPLALEHAPGLAEAVRDGELWRLWYTSVPAPDSMGAEVERRLKLCGTGSMLPFTVVDIRKPETPRIVGMTTYMHLDALNRRLEIGSTWYAKSVQRSALNTESKFLLLRHAFEGLNCIAVEFRTHCLNSPSRTAIERLGAHLDGVLRSHQCLPDGSLRDTAVYSITAAEWGAVRAHLQHELSRRELRS